MAMSAYPLSAICDPTFMLRGYASFRAFELSLADAAGAQRSVLDRLLNRAAATRFGRDHGFSHISNVAEFQSRVPLRTYDDFYSTYWQRSFPRLVDCTWPGLMPYFALSSGTTTGRSKYVPCSHDILASNDKGLHDILVHHVLNRPASRVLGGKTLVLGGSTALKEESPGVFSGDMSGIEACQVCWWEQPWVFPPKDIALIANWEEKISRLAAAAVAEDIRCISGAPNWILLFLDQVFALRGTDALEDCFPNLELVIHGGIGFAPYRERFAKLMAKTHAETREVYFASEGFLAVADRRDGDGMRLVADCGIFFEFVPVSELRSPQPRRFWAGNVEKDVEYAVVLTTCSGLWAYVLGDTVRFVELSPPRILITGRTSYVLSVVGEHLIAAEIDAAMGDAASARGTSVMDYTVGAASQDSSAQTPKHLFIVELTGAAPAGEYCRQFGSDIDARLKMANRDYASYRANDYALGPPELLIVPPGTFAQWMKKRGKLGGQNKVPRILNDAGLFNDLRAHACACVRSQP